MVTKPYEGSKKMNLKYILYIYLSHLETKEATKRKSLIHFAHTSKQHLSAGQLVTNICLKCNLGGYSLKF